MFSVDNKMTNEELKKKLTDVKMGIKNHNEKVRLEREIYELENQDRLYFRFMVMVKRWIGN